jgi:hypothetical protein
MTRQLPKVDIAGTAFYVDVLHEELRQQDNPDNRISFNVFDQDGDGYTFLYDCKRMNIPVNREQMEDSFQWVTLPALMELDPEGIAQKYHIPLEILCPELADPLSEDDDEDDNGFTEDF